MTKQKEIREEFRKHFGFSKKMTEFIFTYLHSKGVVIKVDRELPGAKGGYKTVDDMMRSPDYKYDGFGDICDEVQQDMLAAKFLAVVPLIEVKE